MLEVGVVYTPTKYSGSENKTMPYLMTVRAKDFCSYIFRLMNILKYTIREISWAEKMKPFAVEQSTQEFTVL